MRHKYITMKCINCGAPTQPTKSGQMAKFCTQSCRSKYHSKATLEKRKETNLSKYGVDNPSKSTKIINKRKETNQERYGVDNPFSLKEFQEKQQATMVERYGSPFACKSDQFKKQQSDTWVQNYGSHPWANPIVREKVKQTMLEKYGVETPILNKEILQKIKQTNQERYGAENAAQSDIISQKIKLTLSTQESKQKRINTNLERYGVEHFNELKISKESREILYDKNKLEELVISLGLLGTSTLLDVSVDTVRSKVKKFEIDIPRKSGLQKEIFNYIQTLGVVDLEENTRKLISPKEIDFFSAQYNCAIEVNGSYWHSELNGATRLYHLEKLTKCSQLGIPLLFIWEHDWNQKREIVKSRLAYKFSKVEKIYARNCIIRTLTAKEKTEFFNTTHIQGDCVSSINIGLCAGNELVAAMSFGKPRFSKSADYELLRFSTKLFCHVPGAASKLFNFFVKSHLPKSVISYSDKQYGRGALYEKLNFVHQHTSGPAYHYTKNYKMFESRIKYQKHKLKDILPEFNPEYSEWENMQANGYDRIWDCGTDTWIWTN